MPSETLQQAVQALDKCVDDAEDLADLEEILDAIVDALEDDGLAKGPFDIVDAVEQLGLEDAAVTAARALMRVLRMAGYDEFAPGAVALAQSHLPILHAALVAFPG
jgi:hypothetical protein